MKEAAKINFGYEAPSLSISFLFKKIQISQIDRITPMPNFPTIT